MLGKGRKQMMSQVVTLYPNQKAEKVEKSHAIKSQVMLPPHLYYTNALLWLHF